MRQAPCAIRHATKEDVSFIYNSWLRSFKDSSPWAKLIPNQVFFDNHKKVVSKLLRDSFVFVACNPDMADQIFGYIVCQPTVGKVAVVHYVYIKQPYRRLGIGAALFDRMLHACEHDRTFPVVATHATYALEVLNTKRIQIVYNPYVLGMEAEKDEESYVLACS